MLDTKTPQDGDELIYKLTRDDLVGAMTERSINQDSVDMDRLENMIGEALSEKFAAVIDDAITLSGGKRND